MASEDAHDPSGGGQGSEPIAASLIARRREVNPSTVGTTQWQVHAGLDAGCGIYVHCWGGSGPTGTAIGCWLRRHELATPDDGIKSMNRLRDGDLGGGLKPTPNTPEQAEFIKAWREGA